MRLMTLLLVSTLLLGCAGTRVLDIDLSNEANRNTLVEAAQAQPGEILTDRDVIRFKKNHLQVTRNTLRVEPRGRRSKGQTSVPLSDGPVEVRFRYKGSPLGALIGVVGGAGIGYLAVEACSANSSCGFAAGFGFMAGATLLGAIVGAFIGPKGTTIYRFRPETPEQVSVVVGVGPSITQNGGAR
jgi:hypothetical protein